MALVACPECKREISTEALACPNCGRPITNVYCKHCGKENKNYSASCINCGRSLATASTLQGTKANSKAAHKGGPLESISTMKILYGGAVFIIFVIIVSIFSDNPNIVVKEESERVDPAVKKSDDRLTPTIKQENLKSPQAKKQHEVSTYKPSVRTNEALEQMEVAFDGGYTKEQIKPVLDKALQLYRLPINEENYSRAASTLVALRKQYGTEEMDILDHMIRSYVPGVSIHFSEAAGLSCAFLMAGDK